MSLGLQNKIILASVSRSQVPTNFREWACDLIIEEEVETSNSKKYLQFRHKENKEPPFKIVLSKFKRPASLMHIYKLENEKFALKGKIQRIAECRVEKQAKQVQVKQADIDDEDEYVEKRLVFEKESSEYNSSDDEGSSESSSQGLAPTSDEYKSKIKTAIVQILNKRGGKISSIKDLNVELKKSSYKIKIPESSAKELALKVCSVDKKSKGFVLRPEYLDLDERMEGRKKLKPDCY